jgi:hypothetical protein
VRTTQGRSQVSVREIAPGPGIEVFRIVHSGDTNGIVFLDSLRSHYELSEEPRKVERRWTIMHMGISVYKTSERAIETALTWPQLGRHIARLELCPAMGFNYAHTGHAGHLTLWADPVKLRDVATDIEIVSRQKS